MRLTTLLLVAAAAPPPVTLPYRVLAMSEAAGSLRSGPILKDPDLKQAWRQLGLGDPPDIDFKRETVIVLAVGGRATGGYELRIDAVELAGGVLRVRGVERRPGPGCMTTQALTSPAIVIAIPKRGFQRLAADLRPEPYRC